MADLISTKRESRSRILAEALSTLFLALVVAAANGLHIFYILFPELGAIASDVLLRPSGKWAKEPWKLVATPTVAAAAGLLISRELPYGVFTILLAMSIAIGVVFVLNSAVSPAISAGVLPVVFGITSWQYPACIFGALTVLTCLLLAWRRTAAGSALIPQTRPDDDTIEVLESNPSGKGWLLSLLAFVLVVGTVAQLTTWRFILFPPLIVMAYEMLGRPEACAWAKQPFTFPLACAFSGLVGVLTVRWLGVSPLGAILVMTVTFGTLRALRLRMPPALAIGLIPFILPHPSFKYAVSVAIGSTALTLWFLGYRKLVTHLKSPHALLDPGVSHE